AALGDGTVAAEDRTYLANVVAATTGLAPDEARARVDQVIANVEAARQQAIEAARIARNTAIIAAFLLAASPLVSALGAHRAAPGRPRRAAISATKAPSLPTSSVASNLLEGLRCFEALDCGYWACRSG